MALEPPPVAPQITASAASARRSGWASLRPLVLRLHFYAGVLVAPFLLVAATTGLLYAGSFQAERILYADELRVPVGEAVLPISQQVAAARKVHPEGTVSAVRPSPEAGATTRVLLSGVPGVDKDHTLAVFVDPYTAAVRGALEQYGSTGALPLRTWIDELHANLHLGENGRLYWQRGRSSAFGRPIPRGAWSQVPPHVLVPLAAAIAVLGWFVPLLGLPLAAFLTVDIALGEIAYRRGKRTYPSAS
ncbi:PepSY-associated TM helix domain-containing protein [Actinacidiphila soli]|uniref:PepSY-associated TM helix domain-containing protein n=1 Tax=Actinacidiphila soli TaxID=2487275 RepID=UPI000FCA4B57|nr:PepSY domain-containing protein [Actinacidiphila soli]